MAWDQIRFDLHPAGRSPACQGRVVTTPTSLAAVVQAGDVIGYEGQWRKAQAIKTVVL
jgi:hypothetical protein